VVVAAGASGVALLAAPGSTDRYFSWTLRPPGAAALIGGFYLASAVVFGWGLTLPRRQVRALLIGVLGLAVPTLVLTIVHDEVFNFGRWQAVAWIALFVTAPVSASILLRLLAGDEGSDRALPRWCRGALIVLGAVLAAVAVLVWVDATRDDVIRFSPVDLVRLTGTYLGAWCSFLALLCLHAAVTGSWDEGRVAFVTLGVAAAGAAVALLRTIDDIRHPVVALLACAALGVLAGVMYRASVVSRRSSATRTTRRRR
jgi:hypothetical protein